MTVLFKLLDIKITKKGIEIALTIQVPFPKDRG